MNTVTVALGRRNYKIFIGRDLLARLEEFLPRELSSRCLVVTDDNVDPIYGQRLINVLKSLGFRPAKVVVPAGEASKSLAGAEALYDRAFEHGLDRRSPIIALGGGVVGDLAGFIAATYMRGVPFIQIPTTLLAQVDSSVGGKVAVNHPRGKNIIGAFYQPSAVISDLSLLDTLPVREMRSGMAEVIKYGVIWDDAFFQYLESNLDAAMGLDSRVMQAVVARCCEIKAGIVAEDERESGLRAILNYGHTIGHAVESLGGYHLKNHGEAVAVGMVMEAVLARQMGQLDVKELERLMALIQKVPLDISLPGEWHKQQAIELMRQDKKAVGNEMFFVLPECIGRVHIKKVSDQQLDDLLPVE
ncbi:3-dehydroquinate synthase [Metallumcola ferriviriculae]|uniref:3-dehydroquinate synthase n=1 Tax=Metallumcola ferriviriculae TaxID=3039180 RepID=A0AAU0UPV4_9FIRM|nr:3-dehydroquinate synthase [Desulfitibacteraceae bacterium MK1]